MCIWVKVTSSEGTGKHLTNDLSSVTSFPAITFNQVWMRWATLYLWFGIVREENKEKKEKSCTHLCILKFEFWIFDEEEEDTCRIQISSLSN